MRYGSNTVLDLEVYDEFGKFVCKLDSLKDTFLVIDEEFGHLDITDALLNKDMLAFIGEEVKQNEQTDFERASSIDAEKVVEINLGDTKNKKCKLIGRGILREESTGVDKNFSFSANNVEVSRTFRFGDSDKYLAYCGINSNPFVFNWSFHIMKDEVTRKLIKLRLPN